MERADRRSRVALALLLATALSGTAARAELQESSAWWLDRYGSLPAQHPQVARAEGVFARVAAAAYQRRNRPPRLIVLRHLERPYAAALGDGTILLSQPALELCYRGTDPHRGDDHLAFVLGHELAHLASEDFSHLQGFVQGGPGREPRGVTELQADRQGLLFMTMAGFDPHSLLDRGSSFFTDWMLQEPAAARPATHPPAAQRAAELHGTLAEVADQLDFFHHGVRLYQLGRYRQAQSLLEQFNTAFPGREVLNNLGLVHLQLAFAELGRCDGSLLLRYRLPTLIDGRTLAQGAIKRGDGADACLRSPQFADSLATARRYLEQAIELDPDYLPARLNLLAAQVAGRDGTAALDTASKGSQRFPDEPRLQLATALATHLAAEQLHQPLFSEQAVEQLRQLHHRNPHSADVAYNLASVLSQLGRAAAAEPVWQSFLQLEGEGPYAGQAQRWLERPGSGKAARTATGATAPAVAGPAPPLPLGAIAQGTERALAAMAQRPFHLGQARGNFYRSAELRLLELDYQLELIEARWTGEPSAEALLRSYGPPQRRAVATVGELWIYDRFAVELIENQAHRVTFFTP